MKNKLLFSKEGIRRVLKTFDIVDFVIISIASIILTLLMLILFLKTFIGLITVFIISYLLFSIAIFIAKNKYKNK